MVISKVIVIVIKVIPEKTDVMKNTCTNEEEDNQLLIKMVKML